jgi:hypothetical protein
MSVGLLLFTLAHVLISLVGIGTGFVVIYGFLTAKRLDGWTVVFLATTVLTSVTGFFFPVDHFTPGHAIGILSLLVLGPAIWARYREHMAGRWRLAYIIGSMIAQYFNFAVLIIQTFEKTPGLKEIQPLFLTVHLVTLAVFVGLTIAAVMRFREPAAIPAEPMPNVPALS